MVMEKIREFSGDHASSPVPAGKGLSCFSQGVIWAGSVFCLAAFSIGGTLASGMKWSDFILSVLIGAAVIALLAAAMGVIGAKTRLSSALASRSAFGTVGAMIFSLIIALTLFIWYGVQCSRFAASAGSVLELAGISAVSPRLLAAAGGVLMMITAVTGIRGMKILAAAGVPLLFAALAAAAVITFRKVPAGEILETTRNAGGTMTVPAAVSLITGGFVSIICMIPDVSRFSGSPKAAGGGCAVAFMICFPLVLLLGGLFSYAFSAADLSTVLTVRCGFGLFTLPVLAVSACTTGQSILYSGVLGVTGAIGKETPVPRWLITVIAGAAAALTGIFGIAGHLTGLLDVMNIFIPAVPAAVIADYLLSREYYDPGKASGLPAFRLDTILSAVTGMAVALVCNYVSMFSFITDYVPLCVISIFFSAVSVPILKKALECLDLLRMFGSR